MVRYEFRVTEHYPDCAPEEFGYEVLDSVPRPGDVIALHWLDGRVAYSVRVLSVSGLNICVEKI